jgi:hypothetical protein
MRKRYVASRRHTIQVDFYPYMRRIQRERGRRRGVSHALPARAETPRPAAQAA